MIKKAPGRPAARPLEYGDRVQHTSSTGVQRRGKVRTIYGTRTGTFVVVDFADGASAAFRLSQVKRY